MKTEMYLIFYTTTIKPHNFFVLIFGLRHLTVICCCCFVMYWSVMRNRRSK